MKKNAIKNYIRLTLKNIMGGKLEGFYLGQWFDCVLDICFRTYQPINANEYE